MSATSSAEGDGVKKCEGRKHATLSNVFMIHSLLFTSDASISASNIRRSINLSLIGVLCPNKRYSV